MATSKNNFASSGDGRKKSSTEEKQVMLFAYMESVIAQLQEMKKQRLSETYTAALNSFRRFRRQDLPLGEMDADLMGAYEVALKSTGICPNTISFYMRCLRAVYNRAVRQGLVYQCHPFRNVYTGVEKTIKRAISVKELQQVRQLDLQVAMEKAFARDLFLLSFYLRGCSFVDMAYLKKNNLQQGTLVYRRQKTSQQLRVGWEPCMQEIVDRYGHPDSPYLLPIIRQDGGEERRQYLNAIHRVNYWLKEIGREVGTKMPLTFNCARHTWASIAHSIHIPMSVISEGMGHESESTTRIYLASLDTSVLDEANRQILNCL